jgi:hypothetical protein
MFRHQSPVLSSSFSIEVEKLIPLESSRKKRERTRQETAALGLPAEHSLRAQTGVSDLCAEM